MSDAMQPWPSLREFLDVGGDLTVGWPDLTHLLEHIGADLTLWPPAQRERWATIYREMSKALDDPTRDRELPPIESTFESRRDFAWCAELCDDPELVADVVARLTPNQREQLSQLQDEARRPYPLRVEAGGGEWWNCHNCGTAFDSDVDAVIIGDRSERQPPASYLEVELHYCRECIALALAVLDGTPVVQ